jgi:ribosomal protein S18 acetylase RimI-like enzyme
VSSEPVAHAARRFDIAYAPLAPGVASLGEIAILPWDTEIFGFAVADYRPRASEDLSREVTRLRRAIPDWAAAHAAELIGCRVPADGAQGSTALALAGFRLVETQIRATLTHLSAARLPAGRLTVRPAERLDAEPIARLAESAFAFGRYHSDPLFPRSLANRRFRVWMERALAEPTEGTWIGVVGPPGRPEGFLHAELASEAADVRLVATDPDGSGLAGSELLLGVLHALAARGARRATAQLAAGNGAALNLYASLGFRFHGAELVFHWSRPESRHFAPIPDGA